MWGSLLLPLLVLSLFFWGALAQHTALVSVEIDSALGNAALMQRLAVNLSQGMASVNLTVLEVSGGSASSLATEVCGHGGQWSYAEAGVCRLCTLCGAGEYQVSPCRYTDTVCAAECPAGMYWHVGGAIGGQALGACAACVPGTFAANAGSGACGACPANTYASTYGATACAPCADGLLTLGTGAALCVLAMLLLRVRGRRGALVVVVGLLMMMGGANAQACVPSAGTYCPSGTGAAVSCPTGYYCTGDAQADHTPCPVGTLNAQTGQSSADACQACDVGKVALSTGQSACVQCAAGSVYSNAYTCQTCAAGTRAASGDVSCAACAAGSFSLAGAGSCLSCRPGSYQASQGTSACVACGPGKYTFTSAGGGYTAVWGATSGGQCAALPAQTAQTLVCLPGTYIDKATCTACPIGYYCPQFTVYAFADPKGTGVVQACPVGTSTPESGAVSSADCTAATPLIPFTLAQCSVTPDDISALGSLTVQAMTASLDTSTIYFATSTAVYRTYLQTNTLDLLAGGEGLSSRAFANAVGTAARFGGITAIAVDLELDDATVVVVGDLTTVRVVNVYTRTVTLLDVVDSVKSVGGIALSRDASTGLRWAYVSDTTSHRIMAFSVDQPTQSRVMVAGSAQGTPGYADSSTSGGGKTAFRSPMGLAFLEHTLGASTTLLVADSGNAAIRSVDVGTRNVQTWFAPKDTVSPELVTPVGLAVSPAGSIVYVTDSSLQRASAIQISGTPSAPVSLLTALTLEGTSTAGSYYSAVVPYGSLASSSGTLVGYNELLALDATSGSLASLVETAIAQTADGGGAIATCHLPCEVSGCGPITAAALCGNGFLDAGEQCDEPVGGSGCFAENCTLKPGYACPILAAGGTTPPSACLSPCQGYVYAPTGVTYCTQDCAALQPPSAGYTITPQCALVDIDECIAGTDQCVQGSLCVNTPGAYECQCLNAFFGDGYACNDVAYAVYTVVDLPSVPSSALAGSQAAIDALLAGYAGTLSAAVPAFTSAFSHQTPAQLAAQFVSYSLDPAFADAYTRIELVALFETNAVANAVASGTDAATLATALANAFFGADAGVSVVQAPKVRQHVASAFLGATIMGGWGMNVTGITYNETCQLQAPLEGFSIAPAGGCWQVEMLYVGGQELPQSDQKELSLKQSKNVLYLPRIENDPATLKPLIPAQTLTMSTGMSFACDAATDSRTGQVAFSATACCLRTFEASYRPSLDFNAFLQSGEFGAAVPEAKCAAVGGINGTFPRSDIVFDLPAGTATNDLVVGHIEGMPSSEVRLLETLDYTTRTQRVLLVLEEGDLRKHASQATGTTGVAYSMSFFVGLANFAGTGTSALTTRNAQERITVTKINTLTISTFGSNQDPLLTSETMSLVRITVTDFFNPIQYLYYLQVQLTFPVNFQPPVGAPIIPLDSIRLIKVSGGHTATASSPDWLQVCAGPSSAYVYADAALRTLVGRAQTQECVQTNLAMCAPPTISQGLMSFGVPLPIGFITDADFAGGAVGNPTSLQLQMVVQSLDNVARTNVLSSVSMAVQLTSPIAVNMVCVSLSADHTLMDVIDGSIYIGMPTNNVEWATAMQKQSQIQIPGSSLPANSLSFSTVTVQSSVMTFAALGNQSYFEDPRYHGQSINISDIFTIHFLEPIGSDPNGATPNFDAVKALFFAGQAFNPVVDPVTHKTWLVPSAALLNICPLRPTVGLLSCMTRIDSTYAGNVLTRSVNDVVELRVGDPTSVTEVQNLVGQVLYAGVGASTSFSQQKGTGFYNELVSQLSLNNRYRKAYVINPLMSWSLEAMQSTQPQANAYTVATKIIGIGLITIESASGQQLGRRLLSASVWDTATGSTVDTWETPLTTPPPDAPQQLPVRGGSMLYQVPMQPIPATGRRLLAADAGSLAPSKTQTGNSLLLNIDAPGFDPVTQFCGMVGTPLSNCRMLQYAIQINNVPNKQGLCAAEQQGTLSTLLNEGFASSLRASKGFASNISTALLAQYSIQGCGSAGAGGRRLLEAGQVVVVVSNVLVTLTSGTTFAIVDPARLALIQYFQNATIYRKLLGGNALFTEIDAPIPTWAVNGSTFAENFTFIYNVTSLPPNASDLFAKGGEPPIPSGVTVRITDVPFATDKRTGGGGGTSGGVRDAALVMGANVLLAVALLFVSAQQTLASAGC